LVNPNDFARREIDTRTVAHHRSDMRLSRDMRGALKRDDNHNPVYTEDIAAADVRH